MRPLLALLVIAVLAPAAYSQQNALLSARDASTLYKRSLQLVESTSAAVPGLVRAAAPVLENARQALVNLETGPAGHSGLIYDLLINVRAYLALADSLPSLPNYVCIETSDAGAAFRDESMVGKIRVLSAAPAGWSSWVTATSSSWTSGPVRRRISPHWKFLTKPSRRISPPICMRTTLATSHKFGLEVGSAGGSSR